MLTEILKSLSDIAKNSEPITSQGLSLTHIHQGLSVSPLTWVGSGQIYDIACYCTAAGSADIRTFYLLVDSKLVSFQKYHGGMGYPGLGAPENYSAYGYVLLEDFSFVTDIQVVGTDNGSANCNVGFHARLR